MILSTTPSIEGKKIIKYLGVISGEAIMGANIFKDLFATVRDIVGGRSATYERELHQAKDLATGEIIAEAEKPGANALVAVPLAP